MTYPYKHQLCFKSISPATDARHARVCLAAPSAATFPKSGVWIHHATFLIGTVPKWFGAGRWFFLPLFSLSLLFPHWAKGAYFTAYSIPSLKMGLAGRKWWKKWEKLGEGPSNRLRENLCNQQLIFLSSGHHVVAKRLHSAFVRVFKVSCVSFVLCAFMAQLLFLRRSSF